MVWMVIYSLMRQGHMAVYYLAIIFFGSAFRLTSMSSGRHYTSTHGQFRFPTDYA